MTIVEVVVSIAIFSLVCTTAMALVTHSVRGWSLGVSKESSTDYVTIAMQKLATDIRDGRYASVSSNQLAIQFPVQVQDTITGEKVYTEETDPVARYYYVLNGALVRRTNTTIKKIANGISTATFTPLPGAVLITLTSNNKAGSKTSTTQLTSRITLRNYQNN
jgi:type II secretory pathway pseudopilin PulG